MKKLVYLMLFCFFTGTALFAKGSDSLWVKANDYYSLGEYANALEQYKKIEDDGYMSSKLWYNMGNTYYKMQDDGRAILYYEKALKLDPSNSDIKNNLEIVKLKTLDKIDAVPEFIFSTWVKELRNTMSSDKWAWTGIFMLIVTALLMLAFRHAPSVSQRKVSFIFSCIAAVVALMAFGYSINLKNRANSKDSAIVLAPVSNVKSAPNTTGGNLFILHEGTKVEILEKVGQWSRIELSDGRQGWMESKDFEVI